jgi:hypothetical protein
MNPKSLVAADQNAAAVSPHGDASIASALTVAQTGPVVRRTKRYIRCQIWCSRSFIVQLKCGTFLAADGLIAVLPETKGGDPMKKTLMALAAVATVAVSAVAAPQTAEARNGRIAAGVAAGLIGGAIVGGALAGPGYYGYGPGYGPGYGYYGGPAYVADDYYGACVWQRQRFWDGYGWRVRRVRICG